MRFFKIFSLLTVLLVIFYIVSFATDGSVYNDVVRLHIIADSDSQEDQAIKLSVRDMVLEKYSAALAKYTNKTEAISAAKSLLPNIENDVNEYLKTCSDYTAKVTVEDSYFPTKTYGEYSLPRGEYTALCIRLGKAEGENYWCVLFPPLCLGASSENDKDLFKSCGLDEEEYNLMRGEKPVYKLKFRLLELFS